MKVNILGIKIDDITMAEAVSQVEEWLKGEKKRYIVTPNPEFLMAAKTNPVFAKILNDADLSIPDGVGLKLSGKVKNTVYGTDLMEKLVSLAAENGFTIGLLGGREGVAEKCAECLLRKYPRLKIVYVSSGGIIDSDGKPEGVLSIEYKVLRRGTEKSETSHNTKYIIPNTDLLFVAFGHGKQEKWIVNNLDRLPVKIAMGVGGAFDYISGSVPRAPIWVRQLGLEWLFRLIVQPWRIKRQLVLLKYIWLLTTAK